MAKKAAKKNEGKSLVIVESPAKARTIARFLGDDYEVEASVGHVRDLATGKRQCPEEFKKESWAELGVNVDDGFTPIYVVMTDKKKKVAELKKLVKGAKELLVATDEDREGEAIGWHLTELLNAKVPVHRLVFHEITREAIDHAIANPRELDNALVQAQETRRILDRLYGFGVTDLVRKKIGNKLSAGRVQSVAVRLIVERERERRLFHSATYWDLVGGFARTGEGPFEAVLKSVDNQRLPAGKDFDETTGEIKNTNLLLLDEDGANALAARLSPSEFKVTKLEETPYTDKPRAPFTTSTLQQEANRKLGFSSRRTMDAAQSLYQNGHITYMRTDSTNLAQVAVDASRDLVRSEYGAEYLPDEAVAYSNKVKNAQEAHEAIRPAGHPFQLPGALQSQVTDDEFKLFDLIWKRTVASQMQPARGRRMTITIEGGGAVFTVSGKTIDFPGYLRAYVEGSDDPTAELADQERLLPAVVEGEVIECKQLTPKSHTTQPRPRYTDASLTAKMEDLGIGRPSTYAAIIEKISQNYVFRRGKALVPNWVAFSVTKMMEDHFGGLIDYEFTASMENFLDEISRGEGGRTEYLQKFYFDKENGLRPKLDTKEEEIDRVEINSFTLGKPAPSEELSEEEHEEIFVRVFQNGTSLKQGERWASVPFGMAPDELTLSKAMELLKQAALGDEPLGKTPEGRHVYVKTGKYGPYVQAGERDDEEKPKRASLMKGMELADMNLETALKLLSLPRVIGPHPEDQKPVKAANGRFGPYLEWGDERRSLPKDQNPFDVTLEKAVEVLASPRRRGRGSAREPLRKLGESPVTGEQVNVFEGKYGPYVTDGGINETLKELNPNEVTLEQALALLDQAAERKGGRKKVKKKGAAATKKAAKKKTKKKAAKKKTAKKKAAKKTTAKKKAAKKKAAPKKKKAAEKPAPEATSGDTPPAE